ARGTASMKLRQILRDEQKWDELAARIEADAGALDGDPRAQVAELLELATIAREHQNDKDRAAEMLHRALGIDPGSEEALARKALAELYEREGDDAGLARTLRRQLELDARRLGETGAREWPVNRRVERLTMLRRVANICETRLNDVDGVVYACGGILELLPGDRDALDRMERVLEKAGDTTRLEQTLEYHAAAASGPAERAKVLRR